MLGVDPENGWSGQRVMAFTESYHPLSLSKVGDPNLYGAGNYRLDIASASANPFCSLYFLDSGAGCKDANGKNDYDYIHQNQIDWYLNENDSAAQLSLTFFHIPPVEVRQIGEASAEDISEGRIIRYGPYGEKSEPSSVNSGIYEAMCRKKTTAAFFGHDHKNDWQGKIVEPGRETPWLLYGGSCGYNAYGWKDQPRRIRVIEISETGAMRTWKRLDDKELSIIDEHSLR